MELAILRMTSTDVFLTHDWGTDELGRDNHSRVAEVNTALKAAGLTTWFDSEKMTGTLMSANLQHSADVKFRLNRNIQ